MFERLGQKKAVQNIIEPVLCVLRLIPGMLEQRHLQRPEAIEWFETFASVLGGQTEKK